MTHELEMISEKTVVAKSRRCSGIFLGETKKITTSPQFKITSDLAGVRAEQLPITSQSVTVTLTRPVFFRLEFVSKGQKIYDSLSITL
jgi:hypothetical protein